jgi:hypothetical protein
MTTCRVDFAPRLDLLVLRQVLQQRSQATMGIHSRNRMHSLSQNHLQPASTAKEVHDGHNDRSRTII